MRGRCSLLSLRTPRARRSALASRVGVPPSLRGGGLIVKAPLHLVRAIYAWPLLSPPPRPPPRGLGWLRGRGGAAKGPGCGCGPLPSRPLLAPCVPRAYDCVLIFRRPSTVRPTPAGGEACVRTRCWGLRRAGARFCFRGGRAMPLWPAAGVCGRCLWCDVASLSCHPCSFAVSLAGHVSELGH
jgi:hypothetical protein